MKLEPGWIVIIASVAIFYLRLVQIRGRRKREAREELNTLARTSASRRKKGDQPYRNQGERVTFQVRSWILIVVGALLMLAGLALHSSLDFPATITPYWWAVTAVGVIVFTFSFK